MDARRVRRRRRGAGRALGPQRPVLRLLDRRLRTHRTWGVALHRDLLTEGVVAGLLRRAEVVLTWPVDSRADADRALVLGARGLIADDLAALDA